MKIKCPFCSQHYVIEASNIGQEAQCGSCGQDFVITQEDFFEVEAQPFQPTAESVEEQVPDTEPTMVMPTVQQPVVPMASAPPSHMKTLACEMCGSTDLMKQDGVFVCQSCGTKYSVEEARKMMISGTVNVAGTVKVDNSAYIEKYLSNARRAYEKDDWEEVEKYYNMVERESPKCIEAVFFSAFGKAMLSLTDQEYYKRQQKFDVLNKSISVINDYYEETTEDKEAVLRKICSAVEHMFSVQYVFNPNVMGKISVGSKAWSKQLLSSVKGAVITELKQIQEVHKDEKYLQELIYKLSNLNSGGCYIATAVYGSYNCPQVWTLRRYRDNDLASTFLGRVFIHTYYAISPTLVRWFGESTWFKVFWKKHLDKLVKKLQAAGINDKPYQDKRW